MNAGRDFLLFILFLMALGVAWFLTGGPSKPLSQSGWFMNPLAPLGNGAGYHLPGAISAPNVTASNNAGNAAAPPASNTPTSISNFFHGYRGGAAAAETSPYAQYVTLSSSGVFSTDPQREYVTLRTSRDLAGTITITGWTLKGAQNNATVSIGQVAQVALLGQLNAGAPLSVGPAANVIITSGKSPTGISFRVNKCSGYFSQFQSFTPSLPRDCPTPEEEMLRHPEITAKSTGCQDFVETIPQCTLIERDSIPAGMIGSACKDFIVNTLSYNNCADEHRSDPDFFKNEWRVYLDRTQETWSDLHDDIRLLDENGKLVAEVSY